MSEQSELEKVLNNTTGPEILLELFCRLQNVERLAVKANEALISFLPTDASRELMDNLVEFHQARSSMPIHQAQKHIEDAVTRARADVQSH